MAITTTLPPDLLPYDHAPLPWQSHNQTRCRIGLDKRNAAVCSWQVQIDPSRIARTIRHVPPRQMARIAAIMSSLQSGDSA